MALENILSQEIVQKLGWTLLHFIWQAAAVALLLTILLALLRKAAANVRYIAACAALGLIVLLPIVTIQLVPVSTPQPIAGIESTPAPVIIPAQEIRVIPAVEMTVPEAPVQHENAGTAFNASWKQQAAEKLEPALPYIVAGWLLGVFGLSLWHLGGWAQLQRLRKKMVRQVDASLLTELRQLSQRLRVKRAVQLAESALVQVPTVVGWLRPVILLPASALTGLSSEQLEALLAHELAHIRRYDYLINMLQTLVETLGFYHPAVWWVSHRIRVERENCCDDLAVSISGDRVSYARALTSMEEIRSRHGELAVAASGGNLFGRIRRLVGKDSTEPSRTSWIPSVITILLIAIIVIPTTFALTANNKTKHSANLILDKMLEHRSRVKNLQYVAENNIWRDPAERKRTVESIRKKMRDEGTPERQVQAMTRGMSETPESRYQILKCTVDDEEHIKIEQTGGTYDPSGKKVPGEDKRVWAWNGVLATNFSQRSGFPASANIRDKPQIVTKLGHPWRSFTGVFCKYLQETITAEKPVDVEKLKDGTYRLAFDYKISRYVAVVDPSKGYTCSLQETYNEQGQLNWRTTATYEEVAEGIWFPVSGQRQEHTLEGTVCYRSIAKSSQIRINDPAFNAGYFDVDMPEGATVRDNVQGKQYVVGSKRVYDLDEQQKPSADMEEIDPNSWQEKFYSIYHLEEGQALKRIAPPFIPERRGYFKSVQAGRYSSNTPHHVVSQYFNWDGKLSSRGASIGSGIPRLKSTLESVIGLGNRQYDIPTEILNVDMSGDWIVRKDTPQEELLQALEQIIKDETSRDINFVKQKVETDVIIAKGKYNFQLLPNITDGKYVLISTNKTDTYTGGGGGSGTLGKFLRWVGNRVGMNIIDQTESEDVELSWRNDDSSELSRLNHDIESYNERLDLLLKNLTWQMGLTFERETATVEKWFVSENGIIKAPQKAGASSGADKGAQDNFRLLIEPLRRKGVVLRRPGTVKLRYWDEVFDLDGGGAAAYEVGAYKWPKGADIGFEIDMPGREVGESVFFGINSAYKTTGTRLLVLESHSFEDAVWEVSNKLPELRQSKWMGHSFVRSFNYSPAVMLAVLSDGYSLGDSEAQAGPAPKLAIIQIATAGDKAAEIKYWVQEVTPDQSVVPIGGKEEEIQPGRVILKLVDPNSQPVAGARVGTYVDWSDIAENPPIWFLRSGRSYRTVDVESDEYGKVTLDAEDLFQPEWPAERKARLIAIDAGHFLAGLRELSQKELGTEVTMTLQPGCRVHGRVTAATARKRKWSTKILTVYTYWNFQKLCQYTSKQGRFEFVLPPGKYEVMVYAEDPDKAVKLPILIKPGQRDLDLTKYLDGTSLPPAAETKNLVESNEGQIEGRIIDINTGKGISGVQLAAVPNSSPASKERFACTSAEDGSFAIGGLQSGEYLLRGDFPSVDVDVVSGRSTNDVLIGVRRGQTVPAPKETTAEQQHGGQIIIRMRVIEMPADAMKDVFEPNESLSSGLLVRHGYEIAGRLLTLRQEREDVKQIINPQILMLNNEDSALTITKEEVYTGGYESAEGQPGKLTAQPKILEGGWKFKIHAKILEGGEKVHIELATRQQKPVFETLQYRPGYDYQVPVRPEIFVTEMTAKNGEPVVICRLRPDEPTSCLIVTPSALVPEPLPVPLLGKKLPDPDNIQNIADLKQTEGKQILVCFWDMNQRPSRNFIGELARREKELAEKDVAVYLVHTSKVEPAKLKEWLDNRNILFTCGSIENDAEKVLSRWGVRAQPWLILTDQEGVVRAEGFNIEQLDEKLQLNSVADVLSRTDGANFAGNSKPGESADKPQGKTDDQRKAEVFGRVSQDGRNVVWARVIARIRSDQTSKLDSRPPALNTTTDVNGLYRFADLPAGRYSISVMSPKGNLNMAQKQINLEPGYRTELNFGDEEGFTLTGVVTVDGEAVEIASVWIQLPNKSIKWDWTDRNGKFRITGIPSGQYRLFTTYDKDLDPVTFTWGQDYDTQFDKRQITIENDLSVDIRLEDRSKKENPSGSAPAVPMPARSSTASMENKKIVQVDLSVVEVFSDSKMDRETAVLIDNLLGGKIALSGSPAVADLLRKAAGATAAVKDESAGDKRVIQDQFKTLFDMLVSRGFVKILMRPTLEVVDGHTAKITGTQDSIQITPNVLENGKIDLQFEAALSSESIRRDNEQTPITNKLEISTRIRLSLGESGIISGIKQAGLLTEPGKDVKDSKAPATEMLVILTPTIVETAGNQQNEEMVTRVYHIYDLVLVGARISRGTVDNMMGGSGGMGGQVNIPDQAIVNEAQNIVNLIMQTIAPNSWYENDPNAKGTISPYPAVRPRKLAIYQTFPAHQKIEKLLIGRRERTDTTQISIEVRYLYTNMEFLDEVRDSMGIEFTSDTFLDDKQLETLLRASQKKRDIKSMAPPMVSVLNNETAKYKTVRQVFMSFLGYSEPNNVSQQSTPVPVDTFCIITPRIEDNKNIIVDFVQDIPGLQERIIYDRREMVQSYTETTAITNKRIPNNKTFTFICEIIKFDQDNQTASPAEKKTLIVLIKPTIIVQEEMPRSEAAATIFNSLLSKGDTAEQSDETISLKSVPEEQPGTDKDQILIETKILTVSDEFLKAVGLDPNSLEGTGWWSENLVSNSGEPTAFTFDEHIVDLLLKALQSRKDYKMLTRQKILATEGKQTKIPVVSQAYFIEVAYDPNEPSEAPTTRTGKLQFGTFIRLTPELMPDDKKIALYLEKEVRVLKDFDKDKYKGKHPEEIPPYALYKTTGKIVVYDGDTLPIVGHRIAEPVILTKQEALHQEALWGNITPIRTTFQKSSFSEKPDRLLILVKPTIINSMNF